VAVNDPPVATVSLKSDTTCDRVELVTDEKLASPP
jgi:hypothetical protein